MTTTIINRRLKQPYDIYIGRGTPFGNPFEIGEEFGRVECILEYKKWFQKRLTDTEFRDKVHQLKGKRLGCWCKPLDCHGDIILEYLEGIPYEPKSENIETANPFFEG